MKTPHGIIYLLDDHFGNELGFQNGSMDGVRFRTTWGIVQPDEATLNTVDIDRMLTNAAATGKTCGLSVATGISTPRFVFDAGAAQISVSSPKVGVMPPPWDPVALEKYIALVNQLGAKYDANPSLTYVAMAGFGQVVESYLANTEADIAEFDAAGGLEAWIAGCKQIIDAHAIAFPTTAFVMTASRPYNNQDGLVALQTVATWAAMQYPGRFGLMNASLSASSSTAYYPNVLVQDYSDTNPTGLQFLTSSRGFGGHHLGGTVKKVLNVGLRLLPHFIEVYPVDANDVQWAQTFKNVSRRLAP